METRFVQLLNTKSGSSFMPVKKRNSSKLVKRLLSPQSIEVNAFFSTVAASSSESSPSPLASNAATRTDLSVASAKAIALLGAVTGRMNFLAYRSLHAETDPFLNS